MFLLINSKAHYQIKGKNFYINTIIEFKAVNYNKLFPNRTSINTNNGVKWAETY